MDGENPIHLLSGHGKEKTVTEKESGLKTKGAVTVFWRVRKECGETALGMEKAGGTRQSYRENHTQMPVVNAPTLCKTLGDKVYAVLEETQTGRNVPENPKAQELRG